MKFNVLIALIVVITAPLLADESFAQYSTVAWRGDIAPGTGGVFYLRLGAATVNGVCDAGFSADLNTSLPGNQGAWLGQPPTLDLIALAKDIAPGTGGATFRFIDTPLLTPASEFMTKGLLTSGGSIDGTNNSGIWTGTIGALQLLARKGDQAPGTPVGHVFSSFHRYSTNSPDSGGLVGAMYAFLTGTGVDITNDAGIWAGTPGDLRLVARKSGPAPGMPGLVVGGLHDTWSAINQNGVLGFSGIAGDPITITSIDVAWVGPRTNPQPILRSGDTAANMPAGFAFSSIILRSINSAGDATGGGSIAPPIGLHKSVIWRRSGGVVQLMMIVGDPVPGLPAEVVWDGLAFGPAINANGVVVFESRLAGTGVTLNNDRAIFVGEPGSLTMLAREGDPAPGLGAGVTFAGFQERTLVLNSMDQVAFPTTLSGTGVTAANNSAIFAGSAGALVPVIRTGDSIEVAPGVFRTVASLLVLNLDNTGNEDGKYSYFNDAGVVAFNATFTDGNNGVFTWPGDACAAPANRPPSIDTSPPTSGNVGVLYTYDVDATDPDGDTLTYSLDGGPIGMFIDPVTGLLQWTVLAGQEGANTVTVRASDPDGLFDTQTFDVMVAVPNRSPIIISTPLTDATAGVLYSYDVDATDPDGDMLTYSFSISQAGMTIDPVTGLMQWTPTGAQLGNGTVRVRATDPDGLFAEQTFRILVVAPNQPPTIVSAPSLNATEASVYTYDVDATDPDGDVPTYSLDVAPAGMTIDPVSGLIQWTPTSAQLGANAVTVRADDGHGGFATQLFAIQVAATNLPPVVDAGGPYAGTAGVPLTFNGSDSMDPDGTIVSYDWDFGDGSAGSGPTPSHTYFGDGTFVVALTVTDDSGAIETATATVVINIANLSPVADLGGPYSGTAGLALTLDGSGSVDPDGTIVSYDWDFGDGGMGSGSTPNYTYLAAGTYDVTLTVTDSDGATDTAMSTAVVTEYPTNNAPVCTAALPSTGIIWPPNHQFVPVAVHGVTDSDGDPVSISIDSIFQDEPVNTYGDGDTARDGRGIGTTVAEIRAERSGTKNVPGNGRVYHIGFTASDGRGATCSGAVTVSVPHDVQNIPIDDGALYDSTVP